MAEVSLEMLQVMVQRVLDNQARQSEEAHDTRARLTAIERHLAALRRDNLLDAETTGNIQVQVDRPDERVERIERRLDLRDA